MRKRPDLKCGIGFVALLFSLTTAAQTLTTDADVFRVEAVVFLRTDVNADERLHGPLRQPDTAGAFDLDGSQDAFATTNNVEPVRLSILDGVRRRLTNLPQYEVVSFGAWEQTLEIAGSTVAVALPHGPSVWNPLALYSPPVQPDQSGFGEALETEQIGIDRDPNIYATVATLRLDRGRYTHVVVDAAVNIATSDSDPVLAAGRTTGIGSSPDQDQSIAIDDQPPPYITHRLSETRRVLLGRMHYLDHPYFGLIVHVEKKELSP